MKPSKPNKGNGAELTELLMKVVDVQSRCIEALAMAVGATTEAKDDDDEDDEGEDNDK